MNAVARYNHGTLRFEQEPNCPLHLVRIRCRLAPVDVVRGVVDAGVRVRVQLAGDGAGSHDASAGAGAPAHCVLEGKLHALHGLHRRVGHGRVLGA